MNVLDGAARHTPPGPGEATHWIEHLRAPDLSVGTYSIPRGGRDDQSPHTEDEVYVVTAGRAMFEADQDRTAVGPGSVIYVPAGQLHRFVDVTEDLAAVVLFAPAEGARQPLLASAAEPAARIELLRGRSGKLPSGPGLDS
jgi:quercetin dioxygenase-like cupin family protein